jgi:hypothetical protein
MLFTALSQYVRSALAEQAETERPRRGRPRLSLPQVTVVNAPVL